MQWQNFCAEIQGVEFSGRPFDHKPGFFVADVEGLSSGGQVTTKPISRTGGPGALFTPGRRDEERSIVVTGFAWADNQPTLQNLNEQLMSILADEGEFDDLTYQELGEWRWASVARKGTWQFTRRKRTGFATFQMSLRAPDQRIYGDKLETSGTGQTVTVVNRGSHPAPVEITVSGSRHGYTISGPRSTQAVVTRTLESGSPHTYDGDTGILSVDGVAQATGVSRSDRIEIPRGAHTVAVSSPAQITVSGFDTYIP